MGVREKLKEKLEAEYTEFKEDILQLTKKEIYERSYLIDVTWNLYEIPLAMVESLSEEAVNELYKLENVSEYMFQGWLKEEDSCVSELKAFVEREIIAFCAEKEDE